MITFKYQLNQTDIKLMISDWFGLERVFINNKLVSKKFSWSQTSIHKIKLQNGKTCRLQLLLDNQTNLMSCRIYQQNTLITTLKQGKQHLKDNMRFLEFGTLALTFSLVALIFTL